MNKVKISEQKITDYINQNVAAWAKTLENSRSLTCQVGSSTVVLAGTDTLSVKPLEPRDYSTPANSKWQKISEDEGLEYYSDSNSDTPQGFGKINAGDKATLIKVSAKCSDTHESYQVTLLDAQGNDVKTSIYKAADNQRVNTIKNAICSDAYGRNYQ